MRTQNIEMLKVEGILAEGFGINPKRVMRDPRLSIEAKAIYSYIASFAGSGNTAFPSRDLMIKELNISKDRYYKHFEMLVKCDYVRIEKTTSGNIFNKNVYVLVSHPDPESGETAVNPSAEDPAAKKQKLTQKPISQKASLFETQKMKEENVHSPATCKKTTQLREQLGINDLVKQYPDDARAIELIYLAVEDIALSEEIKIAGAIKKKEAIKSLVSMLNVDNIRTVLHILQKNKSQIFKGKAYIQTCIENSIYSVDIRPKESDIRRQEEIEKQQETQRIENKRNEEYKKHPELKRLDDEIRTLNVELCQTVLKRNDIEKKKIQKQLEEKSIQREKILEKAANF